MQQVTITGKRQWKDGYKTRYECYCNGVRVCDFIDKTPGRLDYGETEEDMINRVKLTCKLIKFMGNNALEEYNKIPLKDLHKINVAVRECDLPEWDV